MISVIIPVYNVENYIEQCIQSVLYQSYQNIEIIMVDDGSTDSSGKLCDEYALKDSRIHVIHKNNEGLVVARKIGLEYSSGEYVTYVDGDDWIDKTTYESMMRDMEENSSDIVIYAHYESLGDSDKPIYHNIPKGYHDKASLTENVYPAMIAGEEFFEWKLFTSVCDKLFKREILIKTQLDVDERITIGEDIACVIPAMFEANSVYVSDKCYYHYRQSTSSMVKKIVDTDEERNKYDILTRFLTNSIVRYNNNLNLLNQMQDLLLFIMVPRSDHLYEGFERLDYLFPFRNIYKGMRVALYCAGTYGQRLYAYLEKSHFCEVTIWVDRNYKEFNMMGLPVKNPKELLNYEYDAIIIATMYYKSRKAIYEYVQSINNNVSIGIIDDQFIRSEEVKKGFRLV